MLKVAQTLGLDGAEYSSPRRPCALGRLALPLAALHSHVTSVSAHILSWLDPGTGWRSHSTGVSTRLNRVQEHSSPMSEHVPNLNLLLVSELEEVSYNIAHARYPTPTHLTLIVWAQSFPTPECTILLDGMPPRGAFILPETLVLAAVRCHSALGFLQG